MGDEDEKPAGSEGAVGGSELAIKDVLKQCKDMADCMLQCQNTLAKQQDIMHSQQTQMQTFLKEQTKNIQVSSSDKLNFRPNKFTGLSQNFSDFLLHFETVAKLNVWSPGTKKKLYMLIGSLNDQALEFISAYDWENLGYEKVVDLLKGRFDKHNLESVSQSKFHSYRKTKNSSWPEVLQDLQVLASRGFKNYGSVASNALVCRKVLDLLADSDLKKQLAFLDVKDPQVLCDKIMVWESLITDKDPAKHSKKSSDDSTINTNSNVEKKLERIESTLASLQVNAVKSDENSKGSNLPGMTKRRCYSCGELGHIFSCCPYQTSFMQPSSAFSPQQFNRPPLFHPRFSYSARPRNNFQGVSRSSFTPRNVSQRFNSNRFAGYTGQYDPTCQYDATNPAYVGGFNESQTYPEQLWQQE